MKLFAFSEYAQKCSTVISAGEPYDLMFTCDWLNNFATNAGSNAYLPLNDLLEENAPDAMADIPEYMWKATTINGNIYAMPALQTYAKNDGIFLRADIAEELGIEGSSYENGVNTYTLDDLANAAMTLMDKGMQTQLQNLLAEYGVEALPALPKNQYGNFATALRGMGANI